jgi:cysteine desulfurase
MGTGHQSEPRDCLVISAIEHPSVLAGGRFPRNAIQTVPVAADGRLDLSALERQLSALADQGLRRPLVSLMLANNETGVVQPVFQAAGLAHAAGAILHVDAVQGAGRIACNINALGADLLTLSGHKIGGPKGVGALVVRAVTKKARAFTPGGIADSARKSAGGLAGSIRSFVDDVRDGMAEREEQIHAAFVDGHAMHGHPDGLDDFYVEEGNYR